MSSGTVSRSGQVLIEMGLDISPTPHQSLTEWRKDACLTPLCKGSAELSPIGEEKEFNRVHEHHSSFV